MKPHKPEHAIIEVRCPACDAILKIDAALGQVISHELPPRPTEGRDLLQAGELLDREKARREELFEKSAAAEKIKTDLLDRKFEEALRKTKDEPITRPQRDIDLD